MTDQEILNVLLSQQQELYHAIFEMNKKVILLSQVDGNVKRLIESLALKIQDASKQSDNPQEQNNESV